MISASQKGDPILQDDAAEAANALTALSISSKVGSDDEEDGSFAIPQRYTKSGRKRAIPFPLKLMKVLSTKKFQDVITWTPSGKSFTILQPKVFVAEILPEHFKSAKYSSFTRKLHRWGFMRHYRGEESGAFYHKDFQKDRLDLVEKMTCKAEAPKCMDAIAKKAPMPKRVVQKGATPVQMQQGLALHGPNQSAQSCVQPAISGLVVQTQMKTTQASMVANHLDAAIEAEVNRRLEERLTQAALTRMFMQQQVNTSVLPVGLRMQLLEMQQKKLTCLAGPTIPLSGSPVLREPPRTNIQGAKTA